MKNSMIESWYSFLKLARFLAWYGVAIVTFFYLLPIAGTVVEGQYDLMSSSAKFFAVIGFFIVVGAWHIISTRDRLRASIALGSGTKLAG